MDESTNEAEAASLMSHQRDQTDGVVISRGQAVTAISLLVLTMAMVGFAVFVRPASPWVNVLIGLGALGVMAEVLALAHRIASNQQSGGEE